MTPWGQKGLGDKDLNTLLTLGPTMNMKRTHIPLIAMAIGLSLNTYGQDLVRKETCARADSTEEFVMQGDYHWNMSLEDILAKEAEIRASGKRLKGRAFVNESGQAVMPIEIYGQGEKHVVLSDRFISSITKQVEKAFERGYVNALIFPDMGHSHLFIPKAFYESELAHLGSKNFDILYQKVFDNPETKVLYHTAEQLQMVDENKEPINDRTLQWRFYTRNILGDLAARGSIDLIHQADHSHNTARDYKNDEYRYWGAGFNISTSKNGCFSYKVGKETYYYDLSFQDLPY